MRFCLFACLAQCAHSLYAYIFLFCKLNVQLRESARRCHSPLSCGSALYFRIRSSARTIVIQSKKQQTAEKPITFVYKESITKVVNTSNNSL